MPSQSPFRSLARWWTDGRLGCELCTGIFLTNPPSFVYVGGEASGPAQPCADFAQMVQHHSVLAAHGA